MAYNASSTYMTFLMKGTGSGTISYSKLVDIKDFPDLGGAPELLDTTTLTDKSRTGVPGIIELDSLEFTANYDPDQYDTLNTQMSTDLQAASHYAVWFGGTEVPGSDPTPSGDKGKFSFDGKLTVWVEGGGVNEVRNMHIAIACTTPITFTKGS